MTRPVPLQSAQPGQPLARADFQGVVALTPLISIDLVVRDPAGRMLLGLRRNRPAQGWWFVPGGRVSKNERLAAAFRRICRDELGVDRELAEARPLGVFEHLYDDNFSGEGEFGTHYVVLAYELRLPSAELPLPEEQHTGYLWLSDAECRTRADVHDNSRAYCGL